MQKKLPASPCRLADEEDVALDAFAAFCGGAKQARSPNCRIARICGGFSLRSPTTRRSTISAASRPRSAAAARSMRKRSWTAWRSWTISWATSPRRSSPRWSPKKCRRLVNLLHDPAVRAVALAKLEGYTNQEIAVQQDFALRSVERRLQLIRKWLLAIEP